MRLLLLMTLITLTACSNGWDQDPFAKDNFNVRNAVPQGANKITTPPIRDVMRIDVDSNYVMKEGQKKIIPLEYRLLHPEFKFVGIKINNLDSELPGAIYDPVKRELVFEPKEGYVPSGAIVLSSILRLSLLAEYKGTLQEVRQEVVFHVIRGSAEAPQIEKVEGLTEELMEGTTSSFKIFIRDEVSPSGPQLVLSKGTGFVKNASQYMRHGVGIASPQDPSLWVFNVDIDLTTDEVTKDKTLFAFSIQAFSALGVPTTLLTKSYTVFSKAEKPKFFFENNLEFTVGEKKSYSFTVADIKAEGKITAQFLDDCGLKLKGTSNCQCKSLIGSYANSARCVLDWTPSEVGDVQLNLKAENTVNSTLQMQDQATNTAVLSIKVVEGGGVQ